MHYLKTLVSAVMAGFTIGFGGIVFLQCESKVVGALFFTIGLFVICTQGLNLYTGKVCYFLQNDKQFKINIPVIWIGNLIGTFLSGLLVHMTRISTAVSEKASTLCAAKAGDDMLSLFVLGIFCNMLIYVAVDGYKNNPHEVGKYLALFFGVVVFILSGFEHSVADMFYISCADAWNSDMLIRVVVISIGNAVGGITAAQIKKWVLSK